jgi:hypothetical protein
MVLILEEGEGMRSGVFGGVWGYANERIGQIP